MHIKLVLMIAMAVAMVSGGTVPIKIRVERDAQGVRDSYDPYRRQTVQEFIDFQAGKPGPNNRYAQAYVPTRAPVRDSYDPNRRKMVQEMNKWRRGNPGPNNRYDQYLKNGGFCFGCY